MTEVIDYPGIEITQYTPPKERFVVTVDHSELSRAQKVAGIVNTVQPDFVRVAPQFDNEGKIVTSFDFHEEIPGCRGESADIFIMLYDLAEALELSPKVEDPTSTFADQEQQINNLVRTKLDLYLEQKRAVQEANREAENNRLNIATEPTSEGIDSHIYIDTDLDTRATLRLADRAASLVFAEFISNRTLDMSEVRKLSMYLRMDLPELIVNTVEEEGKKGTQTADVGINFAQITGPDSSQVLEVMVFDKNNQYPEEVLKQLNKNDLPKRITSSKESEVEGQDRGHGLVKVISDVREELQGNIRFDNTDTGSYVRITVPLTRK